MVSPETDRERESEKGERDAKLKGVAFQVFPCFQDQNAKLNSQVQHDYGYSEHKNRCF